MTRSVQERIDDVRRLLAAARRVVENRAEIVAAIAESTGLSNEGVELGLTKHLELDATDDELRELVRRAGDASSVHVILSSNVFVAGLRAIAVARAAAPRVTVRPSRREPVFARALALAAGDPALRLVDEIDVATIEEGEIHVYGHDETIADVRKRARVKVVAHGVGMGLCWISTAADIEASAIALAQDVIAFDQRGCLSPRAAIVEGDAARASAFADKLHEALDLVTVPRGPLSGDVRSAASRYLATMTYAGRALVGAQHGIGIGAPSSPLLVPPPGRHVHVVASDGVDSAKALIEPIARAVVALGSDDMARAPLVAPAHARLSRLGFMQRPPLDGPVDRRA